jgi:L-alanine-DL-glutamate epimerase-like enolase superfamily enzyme
MPRICQWVNRFGEIIRGMDALANVAVWEKLFALTSPRPGGIEAVDGLPPPAPRGERAQVMAAIAGIDIALWDIKGKAAGLPVYRLLGGENRPIFTYATGGYYRPSATNADYGGELARFIELGYRAVKLKTGAGTVAAEADRIGAVRRAIGDEPLLMLDMNAAYDLPNCIDFARAVEPHGIFWLEEPLHWYLQPADFARLAAATPIPLAHGERELTRFTVRDFIVEGGIRYVQFDAIRAAGFTEALRIAHLAEQHGVMLAPHTAPELHGHLVLATPRCVFGLSHTAGRRLNRWLMASSASTRNCARATYTSATAPASVSRSTGPLSIGTVSGRRRESARYRFTVDIEARERAQPLRRQKLDTVSLQRRYGFNLTTPSHR